MNVTDKMKRVEGYATPHSIETCPRRARAFWMETFMKELGFSGCLVVHDNFEKIKAVMEKEFD